MRAKPVNRCTNAETPHEEHFPQSQEWEQDVPLDATTEEGCLCAMIAVRIPKPPHFQLPVGQQKKTNVHNNARVTDNPRACWNPNKRRVARAREAPAAHSQQLKAIKTELKELIQQYKDYAKGPHDRKARYPKKV